VTTYRTFIADPLGTLNPALLTQVQSELKGLFAGCLGATYTDNTVVTADTSTVPSGAELLVYFVKSGQSVVKNVPAVVDLTAMGSTIYQSGASEVRVTSSSAPLLARLAFHELMHNRLQASDATLHPQGGLAAASVSDTTALSPANATAMSNVIGTPITQWTQGIAILTNGKNDPMSEYYSI
jgi:hypothetical protein